jgi:hypothetical protein
VGINQQARLDELALLILLDEDAERLGDLTDGEREAFEDMVLWVERRPLTPKQRWWVNQVSIRLGFEEVEGPIDDGTPADVRFAKGDIPRGKEVALLVKDKPLRPPVRNPKV